MDKVQIYSVVWIILGLIINMVLDGKEVPIKAGIRHFTITTLISLPIYGRIFGFW